MKKLYHISYKDLGKRVLFKPKIPDNRYEGYDIYHPYLGEKYPENDTVKRICVSHSVMGCLRALPIEFDYYFVYEAIRPIAVTRDMPLYMVPDAKTTGEHWILSNTYMERRGKIKVYYNEGEVKSYRLIEKI